MIQNQERQTSSLCMERRQLEMAKWRHRVADEGNLQTTDAWLRWPRHADASLLIGRPSFDHTTLVCC